MECPSCKAVNPDGAHHCANCGKQLMVDPLGQTSGVQGLNHDPLHTTTPTTATNGAPLLSPGSRLQGGRYVIRKILGQRGIGATLLATDKRMNSKDVAIKELISDNTDALKFQDDMGNFKREVATLADIDHPLVPHVTGSFQEGTRYFMVQEYVEGDTLEERLTNTNRPMLEKEALSCASEVLDILDYLSQQTPPIVHHNIKPANIIIGAKDKRVHLVDFGIAHVDALHKPTTMSGTAGYASPEHYQGNTDTRSDLYALAATLHHLVTNRDPRNHPAFTYPPARSINPQLSLESERVLLRALDKDPDQRYQHVAEMKEAIDDILRRRFGVSGNSSSHVVGTTATGGVIATDKTLLMAQSPQQPATATPSSASPQPAAVVTPPPFNPVGGASSGADGNSRRTTRRIPWPVIVMLILLLLGVVLASFAYFTGKVKTVTVTPVATHTTTSNGPNANGIGVTHIGNEDIGISDGTVTFDVDRPSGIQMRQAADRLKQGDSAGAESLWQAAVSSDTSNAEALIYLENQHVLASGSPYVTLVVATMLTGNNFGVGRADLQGAYVAQKEFNDGAKLGSVRVRLLIANSGNDSTHATLVAQQIVKAAHADTTIVGVMGWPFSNHTLNALNILTQAQLPMLSQTASSDSLTSISPYFFRVAPSNLLQAAAGATYAQQNLGAKSVALFVDRADPYSQSLAADFSKSFTAHGGHIVITENYTVGKTDTLPTSLDTALKVTPVPDLLYFSGNASDVSTILTNLPNYTQFPNIRVMGGDALYNLDGYPSSARAGFNRLRFTAFAYPDEWEVAGLANKKPLFFTAYTAAFDPNRLHKGNPYGYTRPNNDVMLSYDATIALLKGCGIALRVGKTSLTPQALRQALTQISGTNAFQGVSGQISFGSNGDPVDKAIVILAVNPQGFIQMDPHFEGNFLLGS